MWLFLAARSSWSFSPSGLAVVPSYWMVPSMVMTPTASCASDSRSAADDEPRRQEPSEPIDEVMMLVHDAKPANMNAKNKMTATSATIHPRLFGCGAAGCGAGGCIGGICP